MLSSRSLLVITIMTAVVTGTMMSLDTASAEAGRYYRSRPHRYHARPYQPQAHVGVFLYPRGLYVGAGLTASRILHQSTGPGSAAGLIDDGAGLTLFTGLRINRTLALEAGWIGTVHGPDGAAFDQAEHLMLNGFTADARVYLPSSSEGLEPYLQGGLGLYLLDSTYFGTESVGSGFQLGGGFDLRLGDSVKLGLRALYRGLAMGPPDAGYADTYVGALSAEGNLVLQF